MGKKRKQEEYDEDEMIQTIVVCGPYGWNDPKTWDADDKRRNDNGMYVFVEWLEYIYSNGQHGREVVEDVYSWSSRNELLVSIRRDVDLEKQVGKHLFEEMLRHPKWKGTEFHSIIFKAKYQVEDEILRSGDGWKRCQNVPKILPRDIRRYKFTTPYLTPQSAIPSLYNRTYALPIPSWILQAREELGKSKLVNDIKPVIKNEDKDDKSRVKSEDTKSGISGGYGESDGKMLTKDEAGGQVGIKTEPVSVKEEQDTGFVKEEQEELAELIRRQYAYEMENEASSSSTPTVKTENTMDSRLNTFQESDRLVNGRARFN